MMVDKDVQNEVIDYIKSQGTKKLSGFELANKFSIKPYEATHFIRTT